MLRRAARLIVLTVLVLAAMEIALVAWHFPYATDDPVRLEEALQQFYDLAYTQKAGRRS
jgi:hypothetical protein